MCYDFAYEEKLAQTLKNPGITYQDFFIRSIDNPSESLLSSFEQKLSEAMTIDQLRSMVCIYGKKLWEQAVCFNQSRAFAPDDRPLYWTRLRMQTLLGHHLKQLSRLDALIDLQKLLEETSRNYTGITFSSAPKGAVKVLITGFDPFLLNSLAYPKKHNIKQSNPSGCVALCLHHCITGDGGGWIQSMMIPVRYRDFDGSNDPCQGQGLSIIEKYISGWMEEADLIITISHPSRYSIDLFATLHRGGAIDNSGHHRISQSPCIKDEAPWIPTSLPLAMLQEPVFIHDAYQLSPESSMQHGCPEISEKLFFSSPGGNYLSNEIFYRVSRLREIWRVAIAKRSGIWPQKYTGHFHIPKLQNPEVQAADSLLGQDIDYQATAEVVHQVRLAIDRAAAYIARMNFKTLL